MISLFSCFHRNIFLCQIPTAAVTWLKYCWYGENTIQSTNHLNTYLQSSGCRNCRFCRCPFVQWCAVITNCQQSSFLRAMSRQQNIKLGIPPSIVVYSSHVEISKTQAPIVFLKKYIMIIEVVNSSNFKPLVRFGDIGITFIRVSFLF